MATLFVGCTDAPPPITGEVIDEPFASAIVGDTYRVLVRLPPGYDTSPTERYPVVVQLDATTFGPQFDVMAGLVSDLASAGEIPEAIVVGVGYPYDAGFGEPRGRWRDYQTRYGDGTAAGAAPFLRFLREELLPVVHARYRTAPDRGVVLSGHSLGGFFALYALYATAGDEERAFHGFIAADPSLGEDDFALFDLDDALPATAPASARLHLAIARYDGAVQRLAYELLVERLARRTGITLSREVLDTDHGGALAPAYRRGLLQTLGGAP